MENGKELEFHEGPGGGKGSGIRKADSDDRGFPLNRLVPRNDFIRICRNDMNKIAMYHIFKIDG
jgi:hypothetical protein